MEGGWILKKVSEGVEFLVRVEKSHDICSNQARDKLSKERLHIINLGRSYIFFYSKLSP